jgi:hypothetical protein
VGDHRVLPAVVPVLVFPVIVFRGFFWQSHCVEARSPSWGLVAPTGRRSGTIEGVGVLAGLER